MPQLGTTMIADAIIILVLSADNIPDPKDIVEYARRNNAVFTNKPTRKSEYVMIKRPWDTEPHKWGVQTILSRTGRQLLSSRG